MAHSIYQVAKLEAASSSSAPLATLYAWILLYALHQSADDNDWHAARINGIVLW